MTKELAFIPQLLSKKENKVLYNILSILSGVIIISLLAQIAIPLVWTPVPITGQTFGVALTSLLWGRKRGMAVMFLYLFVGSLGLPVFAQAKAGLSWGPTLGYLLGMFFAAIWMGYCADRGFTKNFFSTWLVAISGSVITFLFGIVGLSFFISSDKLLLAGVLPFLPGDFIKTFLACSLAYKTQNQLKKNL